MTDDRKIVIETPRLVLRNWIASDRDLFREINADETVMHFFPFRRSHAEADALLERINSAMRETGLGFYALELKETGQPLGFCGLSLANMPGIFPAETVEIGWRLATRHWGKGYVTEAGHALLQFAFEAKRIEAIVSFAVEENSRSTAVMQRLGLHRIPSMDFHHPRVPDTHPHLQRHVTYAITRDEWLRRNDERQKHPR